MMGNPSTRRTERIMEQSDESNWRNRKWEKPIQEDESPSFTPRTKISIKIDNTEDEQNQRSRLKKLITQRLESQLIALATEQENERDLRSRLKKGIIQRTEPLSITLTQTPFIEEMESDEEETETDEETVETEQEQKKRRELIHAYWTSTMEKEENEQEELNRRRELLHAYSKLTMDNNDEQTEQDKTETYLRTSVEEEQKPSTWEEYDKEEPFEEYDEDESFKENDDKGKWMTQFSYPTEEEENALFIAFMTGNVEDQKTWINAKMNLARATTNEETRRREKEILDRIIPTEILNLDESFGEEAEEETDDLSECRTYDQEDESSPINHGIYSLLFSEEEKSDEFIDEHQEEEDAQPLKPLITSYRDHRRQDKETVYPLSSELDDQLIGAKYFTEPDKCWGYDNEHVKDENRWEMAKTNQKLFEPMVIFSSPCSPTIPQTKMEEIFLNQKNKCRIDIDDNSETEKQNTEYTRCVQQRSRDNDLFTEPERYTSWATRTKYEGMLNPENQPQTEPMKDNGTDIWPTPTTTTAGFRNFDAEFIQNNEDLMKPQNKRNINGQGNNDIIMLPERLFPDSMDQEFDDKWTFENDDEQFDPIK